MSEPTKLTTVQTMSPMLQEWKGQADIVLREVMGLPEKIETPAQSADAADAMKAAHELLKEIDSARKDATKPLDDMKKQIMAAVKPIMEPLKRAKGTCATKIGVFQAEQERKAREEERRLREEAARLEREAEAAADSDDEIGFETAAQRAEDAKSQARAVPVAMAPKSTPESYGRASGVKSYDFEVTDPQAVPRGYLMVNESALRAAAKIKPKPPEIPGVRFFEKRSVRVR